MTGLPLSKWMPTANPRMAKNKNPLENRAVFVGEFHEDTKQVDDID
jgi:hypothetical protein